jgi:hypothetical protein
MRCKVTFDSRRLVAEESCEFLLPAPVSFLAFLEHAHSLADLALHGTHTAALLVALDVFCNDERSSLDPPLRARLCNPVDSFYGPSSSATLYLVFALCVSRAGRKDLADLLHTHISRECWAVAGEYLWIALRVIVLILR